MTAPTFKPIVMSVSALVRAVLLVLVVIGLSADAARAQRPAVVGQISGITSLPAGGVLANATVQLRDLTTKNIIGTVKANASGQFVFIVDAPGTFIVEILDEQGNVGGTSAPITLRPGAMIVSGVSVTPIAGGAVSAIPGGAVAQGESGQGQGGTQAAGAMAGGVSSSSVFMPTLPSVSAAATGSGVSAGTVPSRGTASPSQ